MQKVVKTFKKKWMTKEALNVVKKKHEAYKKYRKLRTNESKVDYNIAKQMAINVTKKAITDFETMIANNIKENIKEFYSYVNNKTTVRSEIAVLKNRDGELQSYNTRKQKCTTLFSPPYLLKKIQPTFLNQNQRCCNQY